MIDETERQMMDLVLTFRSRQLLPHSIAPSEQTRPATQIGAGLAGIPFYWSLKVVVPVRSVKSGPIGDSIA